jgi:hypothetical protein
MPHIPSMHTHLDLNNLDQNQARAARFSPNPPTPVVLSIPGSTAFANAHSASHMHPTHPPSLFVHSGPILSTPLSVSAFGGEIPHPPSFSQSPAQPPLPMHTRHPTYILHTRRPSLSIPDQYQAHHPRDSLLGVKYPTPHRSLNPRFHCFRQCIHSISHAPYARTVSPCPLQTNTERAALSICFWW